MRYFDIILILIISIISLVRTDFLDTACFFQPLKLGRCEGRLLSQIQFQLYTKNNSDKGYPLRLNDVNSLNQSPFIKSDEATLKILIHGLNVESIKEFLQKGKNAYVSLEDDINVLLVDWFEVAIGRLPPRRTYSEAASCTLNVAQEIGKLVKFLIQQGYTSLDKVHVIGYDLGAHLAGMVGRQFDGNLSRITGLDPSRPCFRNQDPSSSARIRSSDARFVDIIHTDGSTGSASNFGQGLLEPLGHADFYANGGIRNQPGCGGRSPHVPNPGDNCSHERSFLLYIETIINPNAFEAYPCRNADEFRRRSCLMEEKRIVGHLTPTLPGGNGRSFYFHTRHEAPYSFAAFSR